MGHGLVRPPVPSGCRLRVVPGVGAALPPGEPADAHTVPPHSVGGARGKFDDGALPPRIRPMLRTKRKQQGKLVSCCGNCLPLRGTGMERTRDASGARGTRAQHGDRRGYLRQWPRQDTPHDQTQNLRRLLSGHGRDGAAGHGGWGIRGPHTTGLTAADTGADQPQPQNAHAGRESLRDVHAGSERAGAAHDAHREAEEPVGADIGGGRGGTGGSRGDDKYRDVGRRDITFW
mmetsp:Transcript_27631/g.55308  ORF Transcript_27631/g.55308 Transcript_27631/m.55308 type:complete len:232 (-) Transcript_27631:182-877(-)